MRTTIPQASERRVCRLLSVPRSVTSPRRRAPQREPVVDHVLTERIEELIGEHPTYGYLRLWALLRFRDGLHVNRKTVYWGGGVSGSSRLTTTRRRQSYFSLYITKEIIIGHVASPCIGCDHGGAFAGRSFLAKHRCRRCIQRQRRKKDPPARYHEEATGFRE
ncbi:MAG: IS3 family transposase [Thermoleophilia bacterium]